MKQQQVLVTGGTGFLALHLIAQLLERNYAVKTTVRSDAKGEQVKAALLQRQVPHSERLTWVVADLTQDTNWDVAMQDVSTVMSVATPVFVSGAHAASEEQVARDGIQRILSAAVSAGVPRVVMTANLGAVGFSALDQRVPVTETMWTDPDQPGLSPYEKSKLLAERAAWEFAAQHPELELVTVNAGAMLGPALGQHVSGSFNLVSRLLAHQAMPNLRVNVVDVRDVAAMHILAMETPQAAGNRYLAVADTPVDIQGIRQLLVNQRPQVADQLTRHLVPTCFVKMLAPVNATLREAALMISLNHDVRNTKAKHQLGWHPQSSAAAAVLPAVDTLLAR